MDLTKAIKILRQTADDLREENSRPMAIDKNKQLKIAKKKFEKFTDGVEKVAIKSLHHKKYDVVYELGSVESITYRANTADGKGSRYLHKFSPKSQPHLAVSFDGKQLFILGGGYIVDERGIVDKPR